MHTSMSATRNPQPTENRNSTERQLVGYLEWAEGALSWSSWVWRVRRDAHAQAFGLAKSTIARPGCDPLRQLKQKNEVSR